MARELTRLKLTIPLRDEGRRVTIPAYRTLVPGLYAHKELAGSGWGLSDDQGHYHPGFHARTLKALRAQIEQALAREAQLCSADYLHKLAAGNLVALTQDDADDCGSCMGMDPPPVLSIAEHWQAVARALRAFPGAGVLTHSEPV